MTNLRLKFNHPVHSDERLAASITDILESTALFAMATISRNKSHINTAYYCFNSQLDIYFLSEIDSNHIQNVSKNKSVALAIYDSGQRWGGNDRGLQLFGECSLAVGPSLAEANDLYSQRFPSFWQLFKRSEESDTGLVNFLPQSGSVRPRILRFYAVRTMSLKLFDEVNFDKEPFVTLTL